MYQFHSDQSQRIYKAATNPYCRPNSTVQLPGLPEFIGACLVGQSKFETFDYRNSFVKNDNCYFSYMYSPVSIWQVKGGGKIADNHAPVAKYISLEYSVYEMVDWIKRRQKQGKFPDDLTTITTVSQYATLLQQCGFFMGWAKYTAQQNLIYYTEGIERGIQDLM